ncbi:hypothetical protein Droror1_Dr00010092 [Drosera rotundifolia]
MQHSVIILSLSLLLVPLVVASVEPNIVGGWLPIQNVTQPHLIAIAKFAITQHNLQEHTKLRYEKILEAKWWAILAAANYLEKIQASDGGASEVYEVVYKLGDNMQLRTFKKV